MKTVSATEAKNRLAALVGEVARGNEDVVIENHGQPRAVLISFELYTELLEAREQQRRRAAMDALWQLADELKAQSWDLDEEATLELARTIADEARAEVFASSNKTEIEKAS